MGVSILLHLCLVSASATAQQRALLSPTASGIAAGVLALAGVVVLLLRRHPLGHARVFGVGLIALAVVGGVGGWADIPRPLLHGAYDYPYASPEAATHAHAQREVSPRLLPQLAFAQPLPTTSNALESEQRPRPERERVLDGWYRPFRITVVRGAVPVLLLTSAGADGTFGTADDLRDPFPLSASECTRLRLTRLTNELAREFAYEHILTTHLLKSAYARHWPEAEYTDGWGRPFRIDASPVPHDPYRRPIFTVCSAGPDGIFATADDLCDVVN